MYHNLWQADAKKQNNSHTLADRSSERVLDINKIDEIYKGIRMENGTMTNKLNAT